MESLFTLYKVVVVPIPILGTNRNSEVIIEGTHFAVSDRGNNFVILDEDELSKCTNSDMSYCPLHRAEMNLARMPSCLGIMRFNLGSYTTRKCWIDKNGIYLI